MAAAGVGSALADASEDWWTLSDVGEKSRYGEGEKRWSQRQRRRTERRREEQIAREVLNRVPWNIILVQDTLSQLLSHLLKLHAMLPRS
jgi:hypothetical protein